MRPTRHAECRRGAKLVRESCWCRWKSCAPEELRSNRPKVKVVYFEFHRIAGLLSVPPNRLTRVESSDGWPIKERSFKGGYDRDLSSIHGAPA